ncbi:MAG TPA: plasmid mobilization relaxosome protein MobC [Ohtaekwangia sp.]|nr:plasmid mobilization relaxosome protein MobC [Ohtaekwangia sp.]
MSRQKINESKRLTYRICVRVSKPYHEKMQDWLDKSNCRSVGELARAILYQEKINWHHKDATFDETAKALVAIRNELRAIGNNINQITHYFNGTAIPNQKIFHALKVKDEYNKVGSKVDQLLIMVSEIGKKWSQR